MLNHLLTQSRTFFFLTLALSISICASPSGFFLSPPPHPMSDVPTPDAFLAALSSTQYHIAASILRRLVATPTDGGAIMSALLEHYAETEQQLADCESRAAAAGAAASHVATCVAEHCAKMQAQADMLQVMCDFFGRVETVVESWSPECRHQSVATAWSLQADEWNCAVLFVSSIAQRGLGASGALGDDYGKEERGSGGGGDLLLLRAALADRVKATTRLNVQSHRVAAAVASGALRFLFGAAARHSNADANGGRDEDSDLASSLLAETCTLVRVVISSATSLVDAEEQRQQQQQPRSSNNTNNPSNGRDGQLASATAGTMLETALGLIETTLADLVCALRLTTTTTQALALRGGAGVTEWLSSQWQVAAAIAAESTDGALRDDGDRRSEARCFFGVPVAPRLDSHSSVAGSEGGIVSGKRSEEGSYSRSSAAYTTSDQFVPYLISVTSHAVLFSAMHAAGSTTSFASAAQIAASVCIEARRAMSGTSGAILQTTTPTTIPGVIRQYFTALLSTSAQQLALLNAVSAASGGPSIPRSRLLFTAPTMRRALQRALLRCRTDVETANDRTTITGPTTEHAIAQLNAAIVACGGDPAAPRLDYHHHPQQQPQSGGGDDDDFATMPSLDTTNCPGEDVLVARTTSAFSYSFTVTTPFATDDRLFEHDDRDGVREGLADGSRRRRRGGGHRDDDDDEEDHFMAGTLPNDATAPAHKRQHLPTYLTRGGHAEAIHWIDMLEQQQQPPGPDGHDAQSNEFNRSNRRPTDWMTLRQSRAATDEHVDAADNSSRVATATVDSGGTNRLYYYAGSDLGPVSFQPTMLDMLMASIRDLDISQIVIPNALEQLHLDGLQHMQYRAAKRCQKQELELLKAKEARGVDDLAPGQLVAHLNAHVDIMERGAACIERRSLRNSFLQATFYSAFRGYYELAMKTTTAAPGVISAAQRGALRGTLQTVAAMTGGRVAVVGDSPASTATGAGGGGRAMDSASGAMVSNMMANNSAAAVDAVLLLQGAIADVFGQALSGDTTLLARTATQSTSLVAAATRQQDASDNGDPALTAEDKDEDPTVSGHTPTLSTVALQQDAMISGSWSAYFVQLLFRCGRSENGLNPDAMSGGRTQLWHAAAALLSRGSGVGSGQLPLLAPPPVSALISISTLRRVQGALARALRDLSVDARDACLDLVFLAAMRDGVVALVSHAAAIMTCAARRRDDRGDHLSSSAAATTIGDTLLRSLERWSRGANGGGGGSAMLLPLGGTGGEGGGLFLELANQLLANEFSHWMARRSKSESHTADGSDGDLFRDSDPMQMEGSNVLDAGVSDDATALIASPVAGVGQHRTLNTKATIASFAFDVVSAIWAGGSSSEQARPTAAVAGMAPRQVPLSPRSARRLPTSPHVGSRIVVGMENAVATRCVGQMLLSASPHGIVSKLVFSPLDGLADVVMRCTGASTWCGAMTANRRPIQHSHDSGVAHQIADAIVAAWLESKIDGKTERPRKTSQLTLLRSLIVTTASRWASSPSSLTEDKVASSHHHVHALLLFLGIATTAAVPPPLPPAVYMARRRAVAICLMDIVREVAATDRLGYRIRGGEGASSAELNSDGAEDTMAATLGVPAWFARRSAGSVDGRGSHPGTTPRAASWLTSLWSRLPETDGGESSSEESEEAEASGDDDDDEDPAAALIATIASDDDVSVPQRRSTASKRRGTTVVTHGSGDRAKRTLTERPRLVQHISRGASDIAAVSAFEQQVTALQMQLRSALSTAITDLASAITRRLTQSGEITQRPTFGKEEVSTASVDVAATVVVAAAADKAQARMARFGVVAAPIVSSTAGATTVTAASTPAAAKGKKESAATTRKRDRAAVAAAEPNPAPADAKATQMEAPHLAGDVEFEGDMSRVALKCTSAIRDARDICARQASALHEAMETALALSPTTTTHRSATLLQAASLTVPVLQFQAYEDLATRLVQSGLARLCVAAHGVVSDAVQRFHQSALVQFENAAGGSAMQQTTPSGLSSPPTMATSAQRACASLIATMMRAANAATAVLGGRHGRESRSAGRRSVVLDGWDVPTAVRQQQQASSTAAAGSSASSSQADIVQAGMTAMVTAAEDLLLSTLHGMMPTGSVSRRAWAVLYQAATMTVSLPELFAQVTGCPLMPPPRREGGGANAAASGKVAADVAAADDVQRLAISLMVSRSVMSVFRRFMPRASLRPWFTCLSLLVDVATCAEKSPARAFAVSEVRRIISSVGRNDSVRLRQHTGDIGEEERPWLASSALRDATLAFVDQYAADAAAAYRRDANDAVDDVANSKLPKLLGAGLSTMATLVEQQQRDALAQEKEGEGENALGASSDISEAQRLHLIRSVAAMDHLCQRLHGRHGLLSGLLARLDRLVARRLSLFVVSSLQEAETLRGNEGEELGAGQDEDPSGAAAAASSALLLVRVRELLDLCHAASDDYAAHDSNGERGSNKSLVAEAVDEEQIVASRRLKRSVIQQACLGGSVLSRAIPVDVAAAAHACLTAHRAATQAAADKAVNTNAATVLIAKSTASNASLALGAAWEKVTAFLAEVAKSSPFPLTAASTEGNALNEGLDVNTVLSAATTPAGVRIHAFESAIALICDLIAVCGTDAATAEEAPGSSIAEVAASALPVSPRKTPPTTATWQAVGGRRRSTSASMSTGVACTVARLLLQRVFRQPSLAQQALIRCPEVSLFFRQAFASTSTATSTATSSSFSSLLLDALRLFRTAPDDSEPLVTAAFEAILTQLQANATALQRQGGSSSAEHRLLSSCAELIAGQAETTYDAVRLSVQSAMAAALDAIQKATTGSVDVERGAPTSVPKGATNRGGRTNAAAREVVPNAAASSADSSWLFSKLKPMLEAWRGAIPSNQSIDSMSHPGKQPSSMPPSPPSSATGVVITPFSVGQPSTMSSAVHLLRREQLMDVHLARLLPYFDRSVHQFLAAALSSQRRAWGHPSSTATTSAGNDRKRDRDGEQHQRMGMPSALRHGSGEADTALSRLGVFDTVVQRFDRFSKVHNDCSNHSNGPHAAAAGPSLVDELLLRVIARAADAQCLRAGLLLRCMVRSHPFQFSADHHTAAETHHVATSELPSSTQVAQRGLSPVELIVALHRLPHFASRMITTSLSGTAARKGGAAGHATNNHTVVPSLAATKVILEAPQPVSLRQAAACVTWCMITMVKPATAAAVSPSSSAFSNAATTLGGGVTIVTPLFHLAEKIHVLNELLQVRPIPPTLTMRTALFLASASLPASMPATQAWYARGSQGVTASLLAAPCGFMSTLGQLMPLAQPSQPSQRLTQMLRLGDPEAPLVAAASSEASSSNSSFLGQTVMEQQPPTTAPDVTQSLNKVQQFIVLRVVPEFVSNKQKVWEQVSLGGRELWNGVLKYIEQQWDPVHHHNGASGQNAALPSVGDPYGHPSATGVNVAMLVQQQQVEMTRLLDLMPTALLEQSLHEPRHRPLLMMLARDAARLPLAVKQVVLAIQQ